MTKFINYRIYSPTLKRMFKIGIILYDLSVAFLESILKIIVKESREIFIHVYMQMLHKITFSCLVLSKSINDIS